MVQYTGDIIPISSRRQPPDLPLPRIAYKEKDFKNRKQYLNARAHAAGYKNYNQWLTARRQAGVEKKAKGGAKPKKEKFAISYTNYAEGVIDGVNRERDIEQTDYRTFSDEEIIDALTAVYKVWEQEREKVKTDSSAVQLNARGFKRMNNADIEDWYEKNSEGALIAIVESKHDLLASALAAIEEHSPDNLYEFLSDIESLTETDILRRV